MAQRGNPGKGKKAHTYSANALAVSLVFGLLLIAFGVLLILSITLFRQSPYEVFKALQTLSHGLTGVLSVLFPVLIVWTGILLILHTQRKVSKRAWVCSCILFVLLAAAVDLLTFYNSDPPVAMLDHMGANNAPFFSCVEQGWQFSVQYSGRAGGGAVGMLLAWPLWKALTNVPAAILVIVLIIAGLFVLFHVNIRGIRAKIQARAERNAARRQEQYRQSGYGPYDAQNAQPLLRQQNARPQYANPQYAQPWPQNGVPQGGHAAPRANGRGGASTPFGFAPAPEETRYVPENGNRPMIGQDAGTEPRQKGSGFISRLFGRNSAAQEEPPVRTARVRQSAHSEPIIGSGVISDPHPDADDVRTPAEDAPEEAEVFAGRAAQQHTGGVRTRKPAAGTAAKKASWKDQVDEKLKNAESASGRRKAAAPQEPMDSYEDDDLPPWEDKVEQPDHVVVPRSQGKDPSTYNPEFRFKPVASGSKPYNAADDGDEEPALPYQYPSLNLLHKPQLQTGIDPGEDEERARRLEATLASFKVNAVVRHVTHGPAVSRFELELAPGIKVNRVTDLASNIAMNMEARSVRIEAPIPGKSLVGVEVPNPTVTSVTLREVLDSDKMRGETKPLVVALGRDIAGTPVTCDLSRMPHLLIAGATGSGKSVCINTIINSLLYRCSPDEVRLILIDPKVVELQCYNGVPHLLLPVVSDPHKASGALGWAVDEMMERYKLFETHGVRNIDGYNSRLKRDEKPMYRIIIVIDELADLMMVCKKDVEERICRIAQLARAAGIHLLVATQRPSVDVITGLIKANIPSRIAFKVTSNVDSRTILDGGGAENLLGWGDMLYKPTGQFAPTRIQGCFLSDDEVNAVCDFIRSTCPAHYDPEIIDRLEHSDDEDAAIPSSGDFAGGPTTGQAGDMPLLARCIEMAVEDGQVSTSMLQRRLRVGYSRAGRLVDEMEKRGIVSMQDGSKPRICLIDREEFERMKASGELDV